MVIDFADFYDLGIDLDDVVGTVLRNLWFSDDGIVKFPKGDVPVLKDDAYERVAVEWDNVTAMLKDELREHFGWEYPDWKAPIAREEYAGKGEITSRPAYNDDDFKLI